MNQDEKQVENEFSGMAENHADTGANNSGGEDFDSDSEYPDGIISEEDLQDLALLDEESPARDDDELVEEAGDDATAELAGDGINHSGDSGGDEDDEAGDDTTESGESDEGEETADGEAEPEGDGASVLPLQSVVEAIMFAAREPLKLVQIAKAAGKRIRQDAIRTALDELNLHYLETGRAFEIAEISERFQLMSRPEYAPHILRLYPKRDTGDKDKDARLSQSALDTLAIIAYKQPVTRGEIEHIRGVGSGPMLRTLIERGLVKVVGKKADVVGQPLMYGTTEAFLISFGLGSLDELPMRNEFLSAFSEPMTVIQPVEEDGEAESGAELELQSESQSEPEADSAAEEAESVMEAETGTVGNEAGESGVIEFVQPDQRELDQDPMESPTTSHDQEDKNAEASEP
ncbi:MAG: SMC-Scp complex subunit ScpB [Planctomycetes bacterium]|nr:SMC-Scp complex subunit ScpB [Planctomycetota bacterium]